MCPLFRVLLYWQDKIVIGEYWSKVKRRRRRRTDCLRRVGCLLVAWWSLGWVGWVGGGRLLVGGREGGRERRKGRRDRERVIEKKERQSGKGEGGGGGGGGVKKTWEVVYTCNKISNFIW